jgi:predicted CoA-binding protein
MTFSYRPDLPRHPPSERNARTSLCAHPEATVTDMTPTISDPSVVRRVLTTPATWAVVGLSNDAGRTAYGVARWMHDALGHRIIAVHPRREEVWGEPGYGSLSEVPDGTVVAVVDCFVNSQRVGAVVDDAIANKDRLGIETVWLQLGVIDHDAAQRAAEAGLDVVMDTCPMMEYPRL